MLCVKVSRRGNGEDVKESDEKVYLKEIKTFGQSMLPEPDRNSMEKK